MSLLEALLGPLKGAEEGSACHSRANEGSESGTVLLQEWQGKAERVHSALDRLQEMEVGRSLHFHSFSIVWTFACRRLVVFPHTNSLSSFTLYNNQEHTMYLPFICCFRC